MPRAGWRCLAATAKRPSDMPRLLWMVFGAGSFFAGAPLVGLVLVGGLSWQCGANTGCVAAKARQAARSGCELQMPSEDLCICCVFLPTLPAILYYIRNQGAEADGTTTLRKQPCLLHHTFSLPALELDKRKGPGCVCVCVLVAVKHVPPRSPPSVCKIMLVPKYLSSVSPYISKRTTNTTNRCRVVPTSR